ncbi:MAG: endonuclease/exonuclease/phosphatase family protein [Clostridia bacterium]|nr:endonuclease/exonuclease/phosphatase family protein [Clostridia bacterium]
MNPGHNSCERAEVAGRRKANHPTGARIAVLLLAIMSAALLTVSCADAGRAENTDTAAPADTSLSAGDTGAETVPDTSAGNPETSKEKETEKEETTMTITGPVNEPVILKIASFNIQHGAQQGLDAVAATLKEADADIVGLQEVDFKTSRVSGVDQPAVIAQKAGYEYYRFIRAIDYKGGEYGTAILSKYPIVSFEVIRLEAGTYEGRSFGHAVIETPGGNIDFFNTHLSYEDKSTRTGQFETIAKKASECPVYLLTGDFNTADYSEFAHFTGASMICNDIRSYGTFPGSGKGIDNIVFRGNFSERNSGIIVNGSSDHYLLWAEFRFIPAK